MTTHQTVMVCPKCHPTRVIGTSGGQMDKSKLSIILGSALPEDNEIYGRDLLEDNEICSRDVGA